MFFLLLCLSLLSLFIYYLFPVFSARKPRLHVKKGSRLHLRALKHLSFLNQVYYPPWWASNGTVNTVARTFQTGPSLPWSRQMVTFPDGGTAALDWLHPNNEENKEATLLVMFPGITGYTQDAPYLWNPAMEAWKKGWRVLVVNRRGLGVPLKTPKIAGSDNSEDVAFILENFVIPNYPKGIKVGLGFSMGGLVISSLVFNAFRMVLFNFLASRTKENAIFNFGMSVSAPFDSHASARSMSQTFPKYFLDWAVGRSLVKTVAPLVIYRLGMNGFRYRELLKDKINFDRVMDGWTIGDFEHNCTAPLNGYSHLNDYYINTTLYLKVEKMPVPFLVLTSEDDYFVPIEWMPLEKFEQSETAVCVVTAHGGHTAYMESSDVNASGLVERVLFEWAEMNIDSNE